MAAHQSKEVICAALIGNSLIAVRKLVGSTITGSSAMLSETIHSVVDSGNQLLHLNVIRLSRTAPDDRHPFGYRMELYFWTFVVAIAIFGIGSGLSFYEGFKHYRHPEPRKSLSVIYIVLVLAMVFEGWAWSVAFREFNRQRGDKPFLQALDGLASVGIGVVLASVAILLAIESKGLLIGKGADPEVEAAISDIEKEAKRRFPAIRRVFLRALSWSGRIADRKASSEQNP